MPACNSCGTPVISSQNTDGFCSSCGLSLVNKNMPCPQCGHTKTTFNNPPPNIHQGIPEHMVYKNSGIALVLAILLGLIGINGIGHIYMEKTGTGVGLLIGCIILLIIGFATIIIGVGIIFLIIYFILFIWQIVDANNLCKKYNHSVLTTGKPPANW